MCNITIIGFANEVPVKNKVFAFIVGSLLCLNRVNILAGNVVGTFRFAFYGAKVVGGKTMAVVDNKLEKKPYSIDQILYTSTKNEKHEQVALLSSAAIVIGGGKHSLHLVKEFIKQGKPIIAIEGSKGIVEGEIQPLGVKVTTLFKAIRQILFTLNETKKLNNKKALTK